MKGLCTKIIKHHALPEHGVEGYPTYEIIAELNYPIEEGEHSNLELNDVLTLRAVRVDLINPGTYSLAFELDQQDDAEQGNYIMDALAAMQYAQHGFLPVQHVIDTMRERIRSVVPDDIQISVELDQGIVSVTVGGSATKMPLGVVYTQHLLTGPMVYSWANNELRLNHNMPPVHMVEQWFVMHNQMLRDNIEDLPDVAACCLVCLGNGADGRLHYAYAVAMMDGSFTTTPMNIGQIICMVNTGKCPEVEIVPAEGGNGINLSLLNDELLPEALTHLDAITDYQLGLTARL